MDDQRKRIQLNPDSQLPPTFIPECASRIKPVLVIAPTRRCGTTLLQRLLNSTRQTVIYGENFVLVERLPGILARYWQNHEFGRRNAEVTWRQFLQGDNSQETSILFPEISGCIQSVTAAFDGIVKHYDGYSTEFGFRSWGIKSQTNSVESFLFFCRLVPRSRILFIYRDLLAVAKSGKARFPDQYPDPAAFRCLGASWATNLERIMSIKWSNAIFLKYEDFIARPEQHLPEIEAFSGVYGIDRTVLQFRTNVSPLIDRLTPAERRTGYRQPATLTNVETGALFADAAGFYEQMGYGRDEARGGVGVAG